LIDEIITALLTLSIGFAIFSWRRWRELKKETAERLRLQEELIKIAETKAETERIICKQLHCEIEEYKKIEQDILSRKDKVKEQAKPKQ
jgi:glucose-6-phosphate-specific signal transduction histidine kinase